MLPKRRQPDYVRGLKITYNHDWKEIIVSACNKWRLPTDRIPVIEDYITRLQWRGYEVLLMGIGIHRFTDLQTVKELMGE